MKNKLSLITAVFTVLIFFTGCKNSGKGKNSAANGNKTVTATKTATVTDSANTSNVSNTAIITNRTNTPKSTVGPAFYSKVNLANFNKLEPGMKYADVVKILGSEGEVMGQSGNAEAENAMYKWTLSDGSFIKVFFQNGKLFDKVQTGLR